MVAKPIRILDPEIVIPSPSSASKPAFWHRLVEWTRDEESLIGPETLAALGDIATKGTVGGQISPSDFWRIIGRLSSRTFKSVQPDRVICERHLRDYYTPKEGDTGNVERLLNDLKGAESAGQIALRTVEACWKVDEHKCMTCEKSRLYRLLSQPGSAEDLVAVAQVWRDGYLSENKGDVSQLESFADRMFPSLLFSDVAWKYLKTLEGSPNENLQPLVSHLSVLNDHVARIWAQQLTTDGRQAEMQARGVAASPESPQIHRDAKAMKKRDLPFGDQTFRCEWHTKLRPNINRIYFAVNDDRVLVGAIIDHL